MKSNASFIQYYLVLIQLFLLAVPLTGQAQLNCFSFEFKECPVSDALLQIGQGAGIKISAPLDALHDKKINRSFKNSKIETIITDMFQGLNYAIVWNYQNDQLVHIQIQLVDSNGLQLILKNQSSGIQSGKNISDNHSIKNDNKNVGQADSQKYISQNFNKNNESAPPAPDPERFKGLELPPMPSGLPQPNSFSN